MIANKKIEFVSLAFLKNNLAVMNLIIMFIVLESRREKITLSQLKY
jgi:hypothetical protein